MLWQGCSLSPSELERNPPRLVLGNSVARVSHSRRQPQPIHPPHSRFSTVLQPPHFRAAPVGRQHTRANRGTGSRLPTGAAVRLPSIGEARGYAPSRRPRPSAFRNPQRLSTHQPHTQPTPLHHPQTTHTPATHLTTATVSVSFHLPRGRGARSPRSRRGRARPWGRSTCRRNTPPPARQGSPRRLPR